MNNKKAQLSIETMIIYGLVILVTLSVIGALLYFNILDLGSYLPDKCDIGGSGDFKCEEWSYVSGELQLGIRNLGQKAVDSLEVTVTDKSLVHFSGDETSLPTDVTYNNIQIGTCADCVSLPPGELALVKIATGGGVVGKTLKGVLLTKYKFAEGVITQEALGSIRIKAS